MLHKATFWEKRRATPLNEWQRKLINMMLDGFEGKLTSSRWAKITKTSQATAGRDIEDLETKGVLCKDAVGGRSTSCSLVDGNAGRT